MRPSGELGYFFKCVFIYEQSKFYKNWLNIVHYIAQCDYKCSRQSKLPNFFQTLYVYNISNYLILMCSQI